MTEREAHELAYEAFAELARMAAAIEEASIAQRAADGDAERLAAATPPRGRADVAGGRAPA